MEKKETSTDSRTNVYELGYILVPTIAEENVAAEVESIKGLIEKHGGSFISEDFPKLRDLAYTMVKSIGSAKHRHDKGYFGWVKFETETSSVPKLNEAFAKNDNILRSMIIETVRENTMVTQKMVFKPTDGAKPEDGEAEVKEPVSEEELDKTIDNLVA